MILLFVLLYISLTGYFLPKEKSADTPVLRIAFLQATIVLSGLFYISTELLSVLGRVDVLSARIFWGVATIFSFILTLKKQPDFLQIIYQRIKFFFRQKEYLLYTILALCIPLLFLALYIPTTNNDSLNYHVSRVIYWIYNGDVEYFPTLNGRQLYYSPFAEYIILQLQLVSNNIIYSNLPQFVSMIGSCVTVSLISEKLFLSKSARNLSVLLAFTLPIGLFESTTTQNDYVCAFYAIASIYFIMELYERMNWGNILLFSTALGLCGLTKYTGWVFATPFLVFYAVLILKKYQFQVVRYLPAALGIFILILAPFTKRNIDTFQAPLGPKAGGELYYDVMNHDIHPVNTIATTIKNIGTAAATPVQLINKVIRKTATFSNKVLGKDIDDKKENFLGLPYSNSFSFHEDRASNFIHFWLFLLAVIPVFFIAERKKAIGYLALLWASFILFSTLFKWQPWHSRMELIWFMMMMPFLGYVYSEFLRKKIFRYLLSGSLILYALVIILLNPSKQLIPIMNLSSSMPSFFSEYDMKLLEQEPVLQKKVKENTRELKELGLNFYLAKDSLNYKEEDKKQILQALDFPKNLSIYQKSYIERMMPLDMTVYHQVRQMMKYIDTPDARIGLSLLAGTREFLVIYPLSLHENVASIKNIAYPKTLAQTPHVQDEYTYDYLLTNNFLLFDKIDSQSIASIQDFAYFKLYKFHQPQTRKYEVMDILQDFSM